MNLNNHFRRNLGSFNSEQARVSRELGSASSGEVSDPHLIHLPKDDNMPPTSPHENVERWIDTWEPVFSSSEEDLPQDDSYSCKSSVYSEDELSLGAEAVLYHLEKNNSTSTCTSRDTDSFDHHPVRRVHSEPTVRTNSREIQEKNGNPGATTTAEIKTSAEEKRARWRNSFKFGSHSFDSVSSDFSSASNVSELLNALDYDPEEVLTNLGFYEPDLRTRIPDRFFQSQSLAKGISVDTFRMTIDEDHIDACTTHSGGSWSDPGSSAIPVRFENSLCKLHSSDAQQNGVRVPEICEPEEVADESFDLMRHLRLQRAQHKIRPGNLLEPVTEELEVSSTGSSVQTRIIKKQSSDDSEDMFVATIRVSSTGVSPESMLTITNEGTQEGVVEAYGEMTDQTSKTQGPFFSKSENNCRLSVRDENENDVSSEERVLLVSNNSQDGVRKHRLFPEVSHLALQESFEMEEIATDEGDISKESQDEVIGKYGPMAEDQRVKVLSRNNSGDSSGFGEGACTDGSLIPAIATSVIEGEATITIKYNCVDDSSTDECSNITSHSRRRKLSKQKQVSDDEAEERLEDNCSEEEIKGESHRKPRRKLGANLDLYFFNSTESNHTVKPCELEAPESPSFLMPSVTIETCLGLNDDCHSDCLGENDVTFISRNIEEQSQNRQKHCLHEIDILEKSIDKYQAGLDVLESISSAHEMFHTKKTLIRMAGDVSAIQSLQWIIKEEMKKIKRLLLERKKLLKENEEEGFDGFEPMNPGITQKMAELLREQSALQDELMRLANDVLVKKKQPNQTDIQPELDTICQKEAEEQYKSREKIEHEVEAANLVMKSKKVRTSLIDELTQTYACELERLQREIQSKDDVIQQLKKKLEAVGDVSEDVMKS